MNDGIDDGLARSRIDGTLASSETHDAPLDDTTSGAEAESRHAANAKIVAASTFFDADWYVATYRVVMETGIDPALHYVKHGGARGWSPGPRFDAAAYLAKYEDVRRTGINPLLHYLQFGRAEGRIIAALAKAPEPPPAPAEAAAPKPDTDTRDEANARLIAESGMFEAEWYVARHPEVPLSGLAPALQYIKAGSAKGWAPGPGFDAADYLARHKDVRQTGMNPLVHYLSFGKAEARTVKPADVEEIHARLIMRSELFDAAWYKATYPEVAKSRLGPLRYFLKHGREKGHNPGPKFDSRKYIEDHDDVQSSKINPLLHYLQFGRAEGRLISEVKAPPVAKPAQTIIDMNPAVTAIREQPKVQRDFAADLALIQSSPLFDKAWYFNRYPDIAKHGMGAAEHYLRFGAAEMRQPSIYFDPQYYVIEQSPEIQQTGINPLVHFLTTGRALGRKPRALFEFVPAPRSGGPSGLTDWPVPAAATDFASSDFPWKRQAELEQNSGAFSLRIGAVLVASAADAALLRSARDRIIVFMRMMGLDRSLDLHLYGSGISLEHDGAPFQSESYTNFGPEMARGASRIIDAWFASDRILRLRAGDDSETERPPVVVRAFQCDVMGRPDLTLCCEALLQQSGPSFIDLKLISGLLPVLIVMSQPDGHVIEAGLLPFPSMCRGGLHCSELLGTSHVSNPMDQLRRLSDRHVRTYMRADAATGSNLLADIAVDVRGAEGTEPIFSQPVLQWISRVFGVSVRASATGHGDNPGEDYLREILDGAARAAPAGRSEVRAGQFTLVLPPDGVPTIAVLTAPRRQPAPVSARCAGAYFVADAVTARPRLSVVLPAMGGDLLDLQPPDTPSAYPVLILHGPAMERVVEQGPAITPDHLAICFKTGPETHRAAMLMPHAPDRQGRLLRSRHVEGSATERVNAVIRASDPRHLDNLLSSLLSQRNIALGEVIAEIRAGQAHSVEFEAVMQRVVPGHGAVVRVRGQRPAVSANRPAWPGDGFTIHAEDTMVLHDARTIETLLTVVKTSRTATAGCVILRESALRKGSLLSFESGGYFPSHVSLLSAPRLILSLPDCRDALADTTYPVIANDPGLFVVRNDLAPALGDISGDGEGEAEDHIAISLKALAAGYRHLCTSVVRATSLKPESRKEISDPSGIECLDSRQWNDILSSVTLVKGLN